MKSHTARLVANRERVSALVWGKTRSQLRGGSQGQAQTAKVSGKTLTAQNFLTVRVAVYLNGGGRDHLKKAGIVLVLDRLV